MGLESVEEEDIWEGFDKAVERAETGLERARSDYRLISSTNDHGVIERTHESLPEVYGVAIAELDEKIDTFDSVYDVTDSELETAESSAVRAEFLAGVTDAYRRHHENVVDRRVNLVGKRFDMLEECVKLESADVSVDQSGISRQVTALRRLVDVGKYAQLQESDRVDLSEIESAVDKFDKMTREAVSAATYVSLALDLAESLRDEYTEDLSALVNKGVDTGAISVSDRADEAPDLEQIAEREKKETLSTEDADTVATVVEVFADIALLTKKRRSIHELGQELLSVLKESPLTDEADVDFDALRASLEMLEFDRIEMEVVALVESEATTTETEKLVQLLEEHDGSLGRTLNAVDRSAEEVFNDLHALFEEGEIQDVEVRFE